MLILSLSVVVSNIVKEFAFLLKDLVLESAGQKVVLCIIENINFCLSTALELIKEVIFSAWLLELIQKLLCHSKASLLNGLILLNILILCEERVFIDCLASLLLDCPLIDIFLIEVLGHVRVNLLIEVLRPLFLCLLLHPLGSSESDLPLLETRLALISRDATTGLLDELFLDVLGHLRFSERPPRHI